MVGAEEEGRREAERLEDRGEVEGQDVLELRLEEVVGCGGFGGVVHVT